MVGERMKIVGVAVEHYRWLRDKPIRNGKHTYTHNELGLVKIETDAGITGVGLGAVGAIEKATIEHLKPELIGEDPIDVERLWHKMWIPKLIGRRGLTTRAISAIDIALWDVRGKAAGLPLYKLLGGYRDRVPTYVAGGYYQEGKGLDGLAAELTENIEVGARAVKMKIGALPIRDDVARVKAAREAVGPDVKLLVDANCAYRHYQAIQIAKRIEEYDPFWFEEPVAPDDYEGHRKLAEATSIPIATGENEYTRYGFRDLINHNSAAILNADAKICGGVSEWMKIAALAQANDGDETHQQANHGDQRQRVEDHGGVEANLEGARKPFEAQGPNGGQDPPAQEQAEGAAHR
jgi:D-arabinonate dehydratase